METVNFSMLSGFTDLAYDGTLTFAGALKRFFIETDKNGNNIGISKNCNETTRLSYLNKYANRILPVIEKRLGAQKPLHSYTGEDLEGILHQLDSGNHYRDSTMLHYRYLLWSVYRAGFRHGLYSDRIFWDDLTELDLTEEENLIRFLALPFLSRKYYRLRYSIMPSAMYSASQEHQDLRPLLEYWQVPVCWMLCENRALSQWRHPQFSFRIVPLSSLFLLPCQNHNRKRAAWRVL